LLESRLVTASRKLRWGSGLLALAYFWAGHGSLISLVHGEHVPSQGIRSGLALVTVALVAVEILVVLVPLRRGEKWALWAALLPLALVGIPRMLTDPTCTAMSLSVHGCHQFMGALLLAAVGFILVSFGLRRRSAERMAA
jgi:hypothetical protein